ncbi:MAG TPA: TerC family protein [Trueperaceae bacterium]
MDASLGFWIGFMVFMLAMLAIDLGIFNRNAHAVSVKEAGIWTIVWVSLALVFCAGLWFMEGHQYGIAFLTGYLIEYSLSVDNIFVFLLIFTAFGVPEKYQHRVLFWGILGAVVLRGAMIGVGAALISSFHWVIYIFGAFLVFIGIRMFFTDQEEEIDFEEHVVLRLVKRVFPVTSHYHGQKFFAIENGRRVLTPLFLVLVVVDVADAIFAIDSIPAIFAVTTDAFIVFTSNMFAILGLRSLYFLLAGVTKKFVYLHYGLAVILTYVGAKMLASEFYHIPTLLSLGVILLVLAVTIIASLIATRGQDPETPDVPQAPGP